MCGPWGPKIAAHMKSTDHIGQEFVDMDPTELSNEQLLSLFAIEETTHNFITYVGPQHLGGKNARCG